MKQGLLSHTVGMRAATGERVVTFDQWAQLFHWIGSRLDIHDTDKLHQRMGAHIGCKELDECRAPLQVWPVAPSSVAEWSHTSTYVYCASDNTT